MGDPEAHRIPPVIMWNPLVQTQCDLACPYCRSSLRTWRWNDGTSPHSMLRSIFSVEERVLLVSCVSLWQSSPTFLHMTPSCLNQSVNQGLEFHLFSFINLHNLISSCIQAGLCIEDIESMLLNLYSSHHSSRAYLQNTVRSDVTGDLVHSEPAVLHILLYQKVYHFSLFT